MSGQSAALLRWVFILIFGLAMLAADLLNWKDEKLTYRKDYSRPSSNFWTPEEYKRLTGHTRVKRFAVIHQTMGELDSSIAWLQKDQGNKSVSANVVIDRDGTRYYLVDSKDIAWHAYAAPADKLDGPYRTLWGWDNENADSVGVELVLEDGESASENQYRSAAEYLLEEGITADPLYIVKHLDINRQKHDPVRFDMPKLFALMHPQGVPIYFKETGHYVSGGFKELWLKNGLVTCGFPLSEEYVEQVDGIGPCTFQDFENLVFIWYPGINARIAAGIRKYKYGK
jgi:hypothetical protein